MIPSALRHLIPLLNVDAFPQQPQGECQLRDKSDRENRGEQEPRRKWRGEHLCNAKGDVTVARNRDQTPMTLGKYPDLWMRWPNRMQQKPKNSRLAP